MTALLSVGCAGWRLPRERWPDFAEQGTHLQRYAARFNAVEINSSFYRPHLPKTYQRWAESVPPGFRFSVKLPKRITHALRLQHCEAALDEFLGQCLHLGEKLGCLLVQLPPSLRYEPVVAASFSVHCASALPVPWCSNRVMPHGVRRKRCWWIGGLLAWSPTLR